MYRNSNLWNQLSLSSVSPEAAESDRKLCRRDNGESSLRFRRAAVSQRTAAAVLLRHLSYPNGSLCSPAKAVRGLTGPVLGEDGADSDRYACGFTIYEEYVLMMLAGECARMARAQGQVALTVYIVRLIKLFYCAWP